ncbi:MAG: glycoside hydrolase family 55 protein [Cellulophaga sp.]|nr:glycoside hydrolase family 55 protein [Cellulophaga sp.]
MNLFLIFFLGLILSSFSQNIPAILNLKNTADDLYLPDFSFAGYHFGEKEIPLHTTKIINATDYGVIANDGLDDSIALIKALKETKDFDGTIVLQLPKGRIILSSILYIERSNFVLRGAVRGKMVLKYTVRGQ